VIAPATAAIEAQFARTPPDPATKELEDLVFWLGARAKPLVPTLQRARTRIVARDEASVRARQALLKIIQSIPAN